MHPAELKNRALTTAAEAQNEGFPATAAAFVNLALLFLKKLGFMMWSFTHVWAESRNATPPLQSLV